MKKKLLLLLTLLVVFLLYHKNLLHIYPAVELAPLPTTKSAVLVPLDNRPPCLLFSQQLSLLAGLKPLTPPAELLQDNFKPMPLPALRSYLQQALPQAPYAILATDTLSYGGLIHSRTEQLATFRQDAGLGLLQELLSSYPSTDFYLYSIIPRLLVSDEVLPDAWWQWHLMRLSVLEDQKRQGLAYNEQEYASLRQRIPPALVAKYEALYQSNAKFNERLLSLARFPNLTDLVIGQDDAQEYGLPNNNRTQAAALLQKYPQRSFYTTQGADELTCLALARISNQLYDFQPRVYVEFGTEAMQHMLLHFVPLSLQAIVQDKLRLIQAKQVSSPEEADFILFVHAGSQEATSYSDIAARVHTLQQQKPLSLVDLTKDYDQRQVLLPYLVAQGSPLVQLVSYAGWNSASNSIGTALAQATIFLGRLSKLPAAERPALYAQNLQFTLDRMVDDWAYQHLVRYKVKELEAVNGLEAESLGPHTQRVTDYSYRELNIYKNLLLYTNWRRFPFYRTDTAEYYLEDYSFTLTLPWARTFEIELLSKSSYSKRSLTNTR